MIETDLSKYNSKGESTYRDLTSSTQGQEDIICLGEESQMEGIALEMTATFDFIQREKEVVEELEEEDEEENYSYSGLQIFTLTCFISSFSLAIFGIICLFLWK